MDLTNINGEKKVRHKSMDLATMMYGKIPPQATDLENAILGAILIDGFCLPEVMNIIFTEVFYRDANQRIFNAILKLYDLNKKIDILTVMDQLKKEEALDLVGGAYYITKLTNDVVSSAHIEAHCRIILQQYLKREMINICGETISEAYEDSSDAFNLYDNTDNRIMNTQQRVLGGEIKDMDYYSSQVYDQYETVKATGILGIKTNIAPIDKIFCGLVAPDLIIIAARPGAGKTSLAISLTHHISVIKKIPGAWFSLEMDGTQLTRRLVSMDSGLSHELIRQGRVWEENESLLFGSIERIKKSPIFIEDKVNINIRSLRTRANLLVRRNKIGYIIVDYLQLMDGIDIKNKNRDTVIGEITRGLKGLAKELNIPVIALSQLSREVEKRADKMPQLSDLRESGNIEQDADEVIFLMRPEYYGFTQSVIIGETEYQAQGLCIGKGAKNRHGATCNFAMKFTGSTMSFSTHPNDLKTPF